jgi:hypothetical protein
VSLNCGNQRGPLFIPQMTYEYGATVEERGESRRIKRRTCPSATLSTANATITDPGAKQGLCCERPAANCLSHPCFRQVYVIWKLFKIKVLYLHEIYILCHILIFLRVAILEKNGRALCEK